MIRAERIVRRDDQSDRRIHARQLFNDDGVIDIAEPRAAQFLGKDNAHQAQFAGLFDGFEREGLRLVPLQNVRPYLRFGKLTDRLSKVDLLLCIRKVHRVSGYLFLDGLAAGHCRKPLPLQCINGASAGRV